MSFSLRNLYSTFRIGTVFSAWSSYIFEDLGIEEDKDYEHVITKSANHKDADDYIIYDETWIDKITHYVNERRKAKQGISDELDVMVFIGNDPYCSSTAIIIPKRLFKITLSKKKDGQITNYFYNIYYKIEESWILLHEIPGRDLKHGYSWNNMLFNYDVDGSLSVYFKSQELDREFPKMYLKKIGYKIDYKPSQSSINKKKVS